MAFGIEGAPQTDWSRENLKSAIAKLQEKPPTFGDEGDTGEKDGKYFAMGYELNKEEYTDFIEQVNKLLDIANENLNEELDKAA